MEPPRSSSETMLDVRLDPIDFDWAIAREDPDLEAPHADRPIFSEETDRFESRPWCAP